MRRPCISRRQAERGFTLLEMLVVIMIMVLIGTLASGGLRMGNQVWAKTQSNARQMRETVAIHSFLVRLVEGAQVIHMRDGSRTPPVFFDGTSDRLQFAARLPSHLAGGTLQHVDLRILNGAAGKDLVLFWQPLGRQRPDFASRERAQKETLVSGLATASFAYSGNATETSQWRQAQALPETVSLRATFADDTAWPVTRIALPIGKVHP